jgi:hypothetical protein
VRRAANVFGRRMQGAVFYYDVIHARRKDGKNATTAVKLGTPWPHRTPKGRLSRPVPCGPTDAAL